MCGANGRGMAKRIVYAWALNAPKKQLPEGVGLRVGGDTDIQYMVLQLHYKEVFPSKPQSVALKPTSRFANLQIYNCVHVFRNIISVNI